MGIASGSKSYTLAEDTDGKLTVASQDEGIVNGLTAELTGMFNGGMSGSTGLSHTIAALGVPVAAAAFQKKQLTGAWGVPFLNN